MNTHFAAKGKLGVSEAIVTETNYLNLLTQPTEIKDFVLIPMCLLPCMK